MARQAKAWYFRRDDCWMAYFRGKKVLLANGKDNRKAAEKKLLELKLLVHHNPIPGALDQTVASVIDCYLQFAASTLATRTFEVAHDKLQAFAEAHGFRPIAQAIPYHLTTWLHSHKQWKSDWTINHAVKIVQRAFNWAVKQGLIEKNPFRGVSHRRGKPRRPITDEEFQMLLRATAGQKTKRRPSPGARFREVLIFLRFTGARPIELCKLEWSQVNFDRSEIVLHEHKTATTQANPGRPRVIMMHPVVHKLLLHIRKRNDPGKWVFVTYFKTPWHRSTLGQRIYRMREKANIPKDVKLYGLRHGFGTRAAINGVELKTLSELMGHTTTRMTEHYLHLAGERPHLAAAMIRANVRRPTA